MTTVMLAKSRKDALLSSERTPRIEVIVRVAHDRGNYPVAQMGLELGFFYSP